MTKSNVRLLSVCRLVHHQSDKSFKTIFYKSVVHSSQISETLVNYFQTDWVSSSTRCVSPPTLGRYLSTPSPGTWSEECFSRKTHCWCPLGPAASWTEIFPELPWNLLDCPHLNNTCGQRRLYYGCYCQVRTIFFTSLVPHTRFCAYLVVMIYACYAQF